MPWPTPIEIWQRLPPRQRNTIGWMLIPLLVLAVAFLLAERFLPTIAEMSTLWHAPDVVEISAFEATQLQEDKRHAGEPCEDWDESEDGIACRFDDGCILAKHIVGSVVTRVYDIHPSRFSEPPPDPHEHSTEVTQAGAPASNGRCVEPWENHGGQWQAETEEATTDYCWRHRFGRFFAPNGYTDHCVLRVPWNACGLYYRFDLAAWVSCYH